MAINRNKVLSKRDLEGEARKESFEKLNRVLRQVQTLSKGGSIQLNPNDTSPVSVKIDWQKLTDELGVEATKNIEFLIKELARDDISLRFHSYETGPRRLYALSNPEALADALSNLIITLTRKDDETKEYDKGAIAEALQAVEAASAYSVTYRYRRQRIRDAIKISMGILGPLAFVGGLFALAIVVFLFPVSLPFVGLVATLGVMGAGAVCLLGALGIKIFERRRYYSGSTWDELSSPLEKAANFAGSAHQFVKGVINATGATPAKVSKNSNLVIFENNRRRKLALLNSDLKRIEKLLAALNLLPNEKALLEKMQALVLERIQVLEHQFYCSDKQVKLVLKNREAPVDKSNAKFDVKKGTLPCSNRWGYSRNRSREDFDSSPLSLQSFLNSDHAKILEKTPIYSPSGLFFTQSKKVNRVLHRSDALKAVRDEYFKQYGFSYNLPRQNEEEWGKPTPEYIPPPPAKRVSSGYSSDSDDDDSGFDILKYGTLSALNAGMSKR